MLLDLLIFVGRLQGETAVLWVRSNVCIVAFRLKKRTSSGPLLLEMR